MSFPPERANTSARHSDRTRFRGVGRALGLACLIYLAPLALLSILSILLARNVALIGIIQSALVLLLFPAPLVLVIGLLLRRWRLSALLAIPVLGLALIYAPLFVPRSQPATEAGSVLQVLTLNIHQPGAGEASEEIAALIQEADADIVALQELGPSPGENFGPLLADQYPYQALYVDENYPGSGQGILSKLPILAEEYWKAGGPWNGNLRVELQIEGRRVVVYNVHPHPPIERGLDPQMESHARVLREVLDRADSDDAAVLLVGDFNMTPQFEPYRWITASYTDAFRAVGEMGFGFTHPHYEALPMPPFWRVDYVFYDEHLRGLEARTLARSSRTDHLPLVARLQLTGPQDRTP